ncbi:hypothetical protein ACF0H5_013288 [Mactra antiquata]
MDSPCVLITSCADYEGEIIVKEILNVETLPEATPEVEHIVSYDWSIDTKYYTAKIKLCVTKERTIGNQTFADSVQAFVVYFDAEKRETFSAVKLWNSYLKEIGPEIKMLVCERCLENSAVGRLEAQTWCIENGFELVEINPEVQSDSETEDDFVETTGIKRIVQCLHAHTWPNMDLKDTKYAMSPFIRQLMKEEHEEQKHNNTTNMKNSEENLINVCKCDNKSQLTENGPAKNINIDETKVETDVCTQCGLTCKTITEGACGDDTKDNKPKTNTDKPMTTDERIDSMLPVEDLQLFEALGSEDPDGESFEKLFEKFAQMKDKANSLPMSERKKYAENVAIAFWKAIGGDEDEIGDLDGDL